MNMTTDMLSAEEKTAYYYFYILNKIKEGLILKDNKNGVVEYNLFLYPSLNDPYKPNSTQEQILIDNLIKSNILEETEKRGDFKIGKHKTGKPIPTGIVYYIMVINPAFEIMYKKYCAIIKNNQIGNVLTFYSNDGRITYISPEGEEYNCKLRINSNPYALLKILTKEPHKVFKFDEIAKDFKELKANINSDNERRVRDAVSFIKKKLKYHKNDLFISEYGFGLRCDVNLR